MRALADIGSVFRRRKATGPGVPFEIVLQNFKVMLEHNNRILDLMADMGDKLGGEYVFDGQYIRTVCAQLSDMVLKLISDYAVLTRQENAELFVAFERIRGELRKELVGTPAFGTDRLVRNMDEPARDMAREVGGKNASLAEVRNVMGLPTPDGFVATTGAFERFMDALGVRQRAAQAMAELERGGDERTVLDDLSRDVSQRIMDADIPQDLAQAVNKAVRRLQGKARLFAVRSSAWGEDGELSFAGQYESFLGVPMAGLPTAFKRVLAGFYSVPALHYRRRMGVREEETAMAVGFQAMVDAQVSGIVYTHDPNAPEAGTMLVSAAWGLCAPVAAGESPADLYTLSRSQPTEVLDRRVARKERRLDLGSESGTVWNDVEEGLRAAPCLDDAKLGELAQAVLSLVRFAKRPLDVEWSFDRSGNLVILQSRPLRIFQELPGRTEVHEAVQGAEVIFSGRGLVAQRGVGVGEVVVLGGSEEPDRVPSGSIVVAPRSSPRFSKVMPRVAGIITEMGSPTGHMATIAREFRVPTVVGVGEAVRLLRNGEKITLDATQNVVYRGVVPELSYFEHTEEEVFEESHEYRQLRRVLRLVTPLGLVNPSSEAFTPAGCRTFHDITRYVHEKSVQELINLSRNRKRYFLDAPRRLETEVPLGLEVIDVEGGTSARPGSRALTAEQVLCDPLDAFLDGLHAAGMWSTDPVYLDMGSLMSSVTRGFATLLAHPDKLGRNLAVVSREYLNLNLRLGYHFTIVDAYVSETLNDNYIYFRFLGGVTDIRRRSRRARFIGEILERTDFRVEIHGDLVVGRIKKLPRPVMRRNMAVLGGLVGYTRQLDVLMDSEQEVGRRVEEFTQRIQHALEAQDGHRA